MPRQVLLVSGRVGGIEPVPGLSVVGAGLGERIATQLPIYSQQVEELT